MTVLPNPLPPRDRWVVGDDGCLVHWTPHVRHISVVALPDGDRTLEFRINGAVTDRVRLPRDAARWLAGQLAPAPKPTSEPPAAPRITLADFIAAYRAQMLGAYLPPRTVVSHIRDIERAIRRNDSLAQDLYPTEAQAAWASIGGDGAVTIARLHALHLDHTEMDHT